MTDEYFTYNYTLRLQESNVSDFEEDLKELNRGDCRVHRCYFIDLSSSRNQREFYIMISTSKISNVFPFLFDLNSRGFFSSISKLVHENYSSYGDQTPIGCFELICIHLRFVPPQTVREHCEKLWPKLMELDD